MTKRELKTLAQQYNVDLSDLLPNRRGRIANSVIEQCKDRLRKAGWGGQEKTSKPKRKTSKGSKSKAPKTAPETAQAQDEFPVRKLSSPFKSGEKLLLVRSGLGVPLGRKVTYLGPTDERYSIVKTPEGTQIVVMTNTLSTPEDHPDVRVVA